MLALAAPRNLLNFEFVGLCFISFLAFCNVAVFYNLFSYLQGLGIPADLCGLVIGAYSLTAMILYLCASPFLSLANAPRTMLIGMTMLILSGPAYFFVHSFEGLVALRVFNGAGQFCMSAGAMALLISVIPVAKSGQAFGVYSVAILIAYGGMPALMDSLASYIPTPPHGYAAVTLALLPAMWIVRQIQRRHRENITAELQKVHMPSWADIRTNVMHLPVALLLLLNISYFINWGSLFFLFKGFAQQQGVTNVGSFFTFQMGMMIIIRLMAGRLFDEIDKVWLVGVSFATMAVGFLALDHLPGIWAVPVLGILFGMGMGVGYPAINGLMFQLSAPHFRSLNANLMLFAVQAGFFLGPVVGGSVVARRGYHGYFLASIVLSLVGTGLSSILSRQQAACDTSR